MPNLGLHPEAYLTIMYQSQGDIKFVKPQGSLVMEGDQSKNSVCYLEISYSTLDSVSLLILNINNVLL